MTNLDFASKLDQLAQQVQELRSIGTPGGYTSNAVLFGGSNGKATHDTTNFVWDNTNKRLGIGTNAPATPLHVKFTGGSVIAARIEQISASGDTLVDLFSSDNSITSGSNFLLGRTASTTLAQIRGDGAIFSNHSLNVGAIGTELIYAQGTIGTAKLQVMTADARMFIWAGQAGVTAFAGGISFNWRQASGAAMGRQDTGTGGSYLRMASNLADMNAVTTAGVVVPVQVWSSIGGNPALGVFGAVAAVQQVSGANLTNNVTAGGTNDTITNWTNLTTYSTDAAAIRNAVYQLARKLKQLNDGLRTLGYFT
jgi:hypothetical protein